jgi:hypothetical protein
MASTTLECRDGDDDAPSPKQHSPNEVSLSEARGAGTVLQRRGTKRTRQAFEDEDGWYVSGLFLSH